MDIEKIAEEIFKRACDVDSEYYEEIAEAILKDTFDDIMLQVRVIGSKQEELMTDDVKK